ncbi:MAG: endolytic transglycosylase MltG [Bacillus sp. (in: firmicutes)]
MNRGSLRGFAAGLLLATGSLAGAYYIEDSRQEQTLTLETLQKESAKLGYKLVKQKDTETNATNSKSIVEEITLAEQEPKTPTSYTLTISPGMSSEDISSMLQQNGIINDQTAFMNYLESNRMSTTIQIGQYVLTQEMSFEQIAKTITK